MHAISPRLVILLVGLPLAVGAALLLADLWSGPRDAPGLEQSHGPPGREAATSGAGPGTGTGAARRPPSASPARLRAASVLRSWDAERSAAYAGGDVAALRRLYTPGSAAGRADVRLLRSYLARGLRVDDLRVQLLSVEVIGAEGIGLEGTRAEGTRAEGTGPEVTGQRGRRPGRLRLRVVDRVARAEAVDVDTGTRQLLPRDSATERVVVLRRAGTGAWRVASVSR